jgi:hypothetical protein
LAAADASPMAPVAAVKANVRNTPLLPVIMFTAAVPCLLFSKQIGNRLARDH